MDTGNRGFPGGDIKVSDAERDQAVAELGEHFQAGRLTQEEFDDRSGRAFQARTGADLTGLFADLPPRRSMTPPQAPFPDPGFALGGPPRPNFLPLGRVIIGVVIGVVLVGGLFGHGYVNHTHVGASTGWVFPIVIVGLVCLRLLARRRRRF